jgi:hypothetical protein
MSVDPFHLLCGGGARFDKTRFKQDIASFKVANCYDNGDVVFCKKWCVWSNKSPPRPRRPVPS